MKTISPAAYYAIHAAKNRHNWGRYMSRQYAIKRNVPASLYRLACQLEAAELALDSDTSRAL